MLCMLEAFSKYRVEGQAPRGTRAGTAGSVDSGVGRERACCGEGAQPTSVQPVCTVRRGYVSRQLGWKGSHELTPEEPC